MPRIFVMNYVNSRASLKDIEISSYTKCIVYIIKVPVVARTICERRYIACKRRRIENRYSIFKSLTRSFSSSLPTSLLSAYPYWKERQAGSTRPPRFPRIGYSRYAHFCNTYGGWAKGEVIRFAVPSICWNVQGRVQIM